MFKSLRITCNEATTLCDKSQYGNITLLEKVKLHFHFLKCKICFLYTQQNSLLTRLYKNKAKSCKKEPLSMSLKDKEVLKKTLAEIQINN